MARPDETRPQDESPEGERPPDEVTERSVHADGGLPEKHPASVPPADTDDPRVPADDDGS